MTTINTIEDLLQVVRENEVFRAAMRRELLTEELLALPSRFADMQNTQNDMLETQNRILADLAETRQIQNDMLGEQRGLRRDVQALHDMYRQQHEDFGRFRGNYASYAMRRNDFEIARLFSRLRGFRHINIRPLTRTELSDILDDHYDAVEDLGLRDRAWLTFQRPDLVAEVTGRKSSEPGFYIAVEASYTGDREDALRATDHAKIVGCATGLASYAIVAAVRMGPNINTSIFHDAAKLIEAQDEDAVLWYQLAESELAPPDVC